MNKITYPLAISQSKATRLKLEDAHYEEHGTIAGMQNFEFRAIPIEAADSDERFENSYEASTLFDLADRIGCSEQGLREKFRAAYKRALLDNDLELYDRFITRYKGYVVSYNMHA